MVTAGPQAAAHGATVRHEPEETPEPMVTAASAGDPPKHQAARRERLSGHEAVPSLWGASVLLRGIARGCCICVLGCVPKSALAVCRRVRRCASPWALHI